MSTACPYCFTILTTDELLLRCTGECPERPDQQASSYIGYEVSTTPIYRQAISAEVRTLSPSYPCRRCKSICTQEVCPTCHRDLPSGWKQSRVFTMAITGPRGAGKSVYIAVMVEVLKRYAELRACTLTPFDQLTRDNYARLYHTPLYRENAAMGGTQRLHMTKPQGGGDPLIWELSGAGVEGRLYLVMRDVSGEDMEQLAGRVPAFSFHDRADLVIFLFDPIMLDSVRQVLSGLIPDVNEDRLGSASREVLPKILGLMESGHASLALTISKFDSLHKVPQANNPMAPALANPAAHFNRDDTMRRGALGGHESAKELERDLAFLDAEVRALFDRIGEHSVTMMAEQAAASGKISGLQHFTVSAVGESPKHDKQLTERGISPFRVLDPVLWGMARAGIIL